MFAPSYRFYVTLLLLNGLVMEAYTTLKTHCFDQKDLFRHFFKGNLLVFIKIEFKSPTSLLYRNHSSLVIDSGMVRGGEVFDT